MTETASQRRTSIVLVVAAAVAWSTAPFFTRLLPFDRMARQAVRQLADGQQIAAGRIQRAGVSGDHGIALR